MPIATKVLSSNPVHGEMYSIKTVCDKVCQWFAVGVWFSPGTPISSTNKTYSHDIAEILLKVALNTIRPIIQLSPFMIIGIIGIIGISAFNSVHSAIIIGPH